MTGAAGHLAPGAGVAGFRVGGEDGEPAWAITGTGHSILYFASQGTPYLLRTTGPGTDISFGEWNAVTIPVPPAAGRRVSLAQLASA